MCSPRLQWDNSETTFKFTYVCIDVEGILNHASSWLALGFVRCGWGLLGVFGLSGRQTTAESWMARENEGCGVYLESFSYVFSLFLSHPWFRNECR
jgi:hypothetical protein